jgi:hypothetical protein
MKSSLRTEPWPWLGDSREDKARRVADSYRDLVRRIAQGQCDDPAGECHRLDQTWIARGIDWLNPNRDKPLDPDEWMTAPDLAALIGRPRKDIYNWARLGHIQQRCGPDGAPEYLAGSVVQYHARLRHRRAGLSRI